jgi:hypothetical protein
VSGFPTAKLAELEAIYRTHRRFPGLRQRGPKGLCAPKRILGLLYIIAAADRPAAALHLSLRETIRKTVMPGKESRLAS